MNETVATPQNDQAPTSWWTVTQYSLRDLDRGLFASISWYETGARPWHLVAASYLVDVEGLTDTWHASAEAAMAAVEQRIASAAA